MGIDLELCRARVGLWAGKRLCLKQYNKCGKKKQPCFGTEELLGLSVVVAFSVFLLLAGDIETNPGPLYRMCGICSIESVKNYYLYDASKVAYTELYHKLKYVSGDHHITLASTYGCMRCRGSILTCSNQKARYEESREVNDTALKKRQTMHSVVREQRRVPQKRTLPSPH